MDWWAAIKDWLNEYQLIIMLVDFLIGIVGFTVAIVEIRRTKKSVDASEAATKAALAATEATLDELAATLTVEDVSRITASIRGVQALLRSNRFESAVDGIQAAREGLRQLSLFST